MSSNLYYENILILGTAEVIADTTVGSTFDNCIDGRTSTQAEFASGDYGIVALATAGQNKTCDYIGIAKHNLGTTGATLNVYADDNSGMTSPQTVFSGTVSTDNVTIIPVNQSSETYIKVEISGGSGSTFIADISIGRKLTLESGMPMGYMPPKYALNTQVINSVSQSADICGSVVIPKSKTARIDIRFTDEQWFDDNWDDFISHLPRPFYFVWDDVSHADDAAFIWIKKKYPQVKFGPGNYQSAQIDGEGIT